MAPHSSTLAWKIPWTEEPGRLQSMASLSVRHDWATSLHFHALEKEMATHSIVLAWRIPGMGEPGGLPSKRCPGVRFYHFHFSLSCIGEGNGNSLHCSCLENPTDGGAWWAAVYGVALSQTDWSDLAAAAAAAGNEYQKSQKFLKKTLGHMPQYGDHFRQSPYLLCFLEYFSAPYTYQKVLFL